MEKPACTINFEQGQRSLVTGTLEEVQEALSAGGMVQFTDPWRRPVVVNAANVTTVEPLPGGIETED